MSLKLPQEDFAQLLGASRVTKYEGSMEKVAEVLEYCSFPTLEGVKLFQRLIFSFLVVNEDMHLKNFSLITETTNRIRLSPVKEIERMIKIIPTWKETIDSSFLSELMKKEYKLLIDKRAKRLSNI